MNGSTTAAPLTIKRTYDATPDRVFAAWTDPAILAHWFAPPTFTFDGAETDVRPGGAFRLASRAADGELFAARGTYRDVSPPNRLAFSWAWEEDDGTLATPMEIVIDIVATGSGSEMTFTQSGFANDESRARHEQGWCATFETLESYLG